MLEGNTKGAILVVTYERWHTTTYIGVVANLRTATNDKMIKGLKRPLQAYTWQVVWTLFTFYWATRNHSEIGQWIWIIGVLAGLVSLIHMIIKRNYVEIAENKLILNDSIFRKRTIELNQIQKFEYEPGPFTSSKIILKDNTKVKYHDSQTDSKELKEFMAQFNILVE